MFYNVVYIIIVATVIQCALFYRYNAAHARTRSVIERCFGVLKMRFRCLDRSGGILSLSPGRTCRDWMDWDRNHVLRVTPGPCQYALEDGGAEDVTHIGDGIFIISTGFNWEGNPGKIQSIDTRGRAPVTTTLTISSAPMWNDFLGAPTGISTWKDPDTGELFLYVLTHPPKEDRVEVFEILRQPLRLRYVKTITDQSFTFMNNLVVVGKDKFYTTRISHYRAILILKLEHLGHNIRNGGIMYYNGHKAREVASGYYLPNGINISPDKKMVYMACWGQKTLFGFLRETDGGLTQIWSEYIGTGLDNIRVDPDTGNLYIGSHPVTWRIIDFFNLFGSTPPSQVLRVKMRDNAVSQIEEIYSDDGGELSGSSAAMIGDGKLVIGTIFKQTLVCDVKYLSE